MAHITGTAPQRKWRPALLCAALVFAAPAALTRFAPSQTPPQETAPSYDALLRAVKQADALGDDARALRLSQLAVTTDPARHEVFVFAAYILYRQGRHSLADQAMQDACRLSAGETRQRLQVLRQTLRESHGEAAFQRHLAAGRDALLQNLPARAAEELVAAFAIKESAVDVGLEAANALMTIEEWSRAKGVLERVVAVAKSSKARQEAQAMLALATPIAAANYRAAIEAAEALLKKSPSEARSQLLNAIAADPERPDAFLLLSQLEVDRHQFDAAVAALRQAVRRGYLDRSELLEGDRFRPLIEHAGFRQLLRDAFGERGLATRDNATTAAAAAPAKSIDNSIGMQLLLVPRGRFILGSPIDEPGRDGRYETPHQVVLSKDYYLSATEVTQTQWVAVMGSNPSPRQGANLPVHRVTYREATDFCARLSKSEGVPYRLPSEAEWENACRAGSQHRYSGGDDLDSLRRQGLTKESSPAPTGPQQVASLAANAWGFFDMHGNVQEWCLDGFAAFNSDEATDPLSDPAMARQVVKGGAYSSTKNASRCAHRARLAPEHRAINLGFRVLREIPGQ